MQKLFFYLNLNKCLDVNVVLLMSISINYKMTFNLSSNFNLMAMYRSFSMQFKWNNWNIGAWEKIHILEEKFRRHLDAFASEIVTHSNINKGHFSFSFI